MNLRFISVQSKRLAVLAASLPLWLAVPASAQTPPSGAAPAAGSFRSALEGYQPHTEEKLINWKEANDTVGRIGGWRAYAKEAQQGAAPAAPGAAGQPDPHAGHGKPPQDKKP